MKLLKFLVMLNAVIFVLCFILSKAHAETRIKVAVIDTGINESRAISPYICNEGHLDLTGTGLNDTHGHGTNIAYILARGLNPSSACLLIIKWTNGNGTATDAQETDRLGTAVMFAVAHNAKYVNISSGGRMADEKEKKAIEDGLKKNIVFATAAGNDNKNLSKECYYYPGCYAFKNPNFFVVASYAYSVKASYSNYDGPVNGYEDGTRVDAGGKIFTGTSQATAIFLSKLIQKREGYAIRHLTDHNKPIDCLPAQD